MLPGEVQDPLSLVLQLVRSWDSSPALTPWGLAHPCFHHQGQLHCIRQVKCRTLSPSATASEWGGITLQLSSPQAQLFPLLQVAKEVGVGHHPMAPPSHCTHARCVVGPARPLGLEAGTPASPPPGPALLFCPDKVLGPLSQVLRRAECEGQVL